LAVSIEEMKLLLGDELEKVLGVFKCPSYFTDLEAVLGFFEIEMRRKGEEKGRD
jgi:hypothetical protein